MQPYIIMCSFVFWGLYWYEWMPQSRCLSMPIALALHVVDRIPSQKMDHIGSQQRLSKWLLLPPCLPSHSCWRIVGFMFFYHSERMWNVKLQFKLKGKLFNFMQELVNLTMYTISIKCFSLWQELFLLQLWLRKIRHSTTDCNYVWILQSRCFSLQ